MHCKHEELEECSVYLSSSLAHLCRPYKGDPRGSCGMHIARDGESYSHFIERIMSYHEKRKLKGVDDMFICIPSEQYVQIMGILKSINS